MGQIFSLGDKEPLSERDMKQLLGTSYILEHKADFEPGRTSDFILRVKFMRDLYDMQGRLVARKDDATEALALSLRDYTGPSLQIEPINIRTGNGNVTYAGAPSVTASPISFTDYIGKKTEQILLAWYSMAHNIVTDKIGFKEYYGQDGILYKWAPNGTRQISWRLYGCWLSEYNLGQYSRIQPDQRIFQTVIQYDKAVPFAQPTYSDWIVDEENNDTSGAYNNYTNANYLGTLSNQKTV